jgi:hypothetical protein
MTYRMSIGGGQMGVAPFLVENGRVSTQVNENQRPPSGGEPSEVA